MKKKIVRLNVLGLNSIKPLTIFGDKNIIKNIKKTNDGLSVEIRDGVDELDNLVLWTEGWLYQSKPRTPENGHGAFRWQSIPEKESVSHELVNPLDWTAWRVA